MKIIKIPWSKGNMKKNLGCEYAPDEVIKELENIFLNEKGKETNFSVEEIEIKEDNFEETNENIFEKIKDIKEKAIILGGDHSITYSAVKGFAEANKNTGIIILDAHPDCQSNFEPPTHEDFVRGLINKKIIKKENIILLGIRNWHKEEEEFLKENKINCFSMKEVSFEGLRKTIDSLMEIAKNWGSLYLSVDIDTIDPAFAPGTGYLEPGGFTSREILYIIQRLKKLKNLKMVDLVEINPKKDLNKMTIKLGAKIVNELL